jgi:hypothetical protein
MALREPVAVYNAANNVEALLLKMRLVEAGVEAFASEDLSPGGLWAFGILPEIHKPQVWVSKFDVDQARAILQDYERETTERRQASEAVESASGSPIEVVCEDCGEASLFPSAQRGSVQECPRCGGYVDVGAIDESDAFWRQDDQGDSP